MAKKSKVITPRQLKPPSMVLTYSGGSFCWIIDVSVVRVHQHEAGVARIKDAYAANRMNHSSCRTRLNFQRQGPASALVVGLSRLKRKFLVRLCAFHRRFA